LACARVGMGGMAAFGGPREEEEADEEEEVGFSVLAAFSLAACTHRQIGSRTPTVMIVIMMVVSTTVMKMT